MSLLVLNVYIQKNKKHNQKNVCFFGLPNHIKNVVLTDLDRNPNAGLRAHKPKKAGIQAHCLFKK